MTAPAATGAALQTAKLPSDERLVRLLGLFEVSLAAAVVGPGGRVPALLLGLTYTACAVFAAQQARRGADCGCFGAVATPTTGLHVALNVVGAGAGLLAALVGAPGVTAVAMSPADRVVLVALLATAVGLLRLTLTTLPDLAAARRLHTTEVGQ